MDDQQSPADRLSDAPTMLLPQVAQAATASRAFARSLRKRLLLPQDASQRRRVQLIALLLLLLLGAPTLLTVAVGIHDVATLKTLGQSGLSHLLATQSDLTGKTSSPSAGSSPSSGGSSAALMAALRTLLTAPGPDATNPAYTYLAQRQGGTLNPLTVTVHPAPGVVAEGTTTTNFQTTLTTNTYFAVGGQPKATPTTTPAATPSAISTPATSAQTTSTGQHSTLPDAAHIAAALGDLRAAQRDFQSLSDQIDHPDIALALAGVLPIAGGDVRAAQALAHTGLDISVAGVALLTAATPLLTRLHSTSAATTGQQKLITSADISALHAAMNIAAARLGDASQRLNGVDVNALPLSARQKALFAEFAPLLPQVSALLPLASSAVDVAGWLLGVDQPRHFLVQTLDRGEMRASGGFTGQFGVLTFDDGKMSPFSLQDVNCIDYLTGCRANGWTFGRHAPAPYNVWWPFGDWGLRDSNLSGDFPTNARLVTDVYQHESGEQVDGLINVSPIAIEDVLRVVGPIEVPLYGETITADNLEAKLHYYQQDPAAIAKEQQLSAGDTSTSGRKRFTQLVGQLLQERVKSLPMSALAPLAVRMLADLRSKDLEVYFANPQAETLLARFHADGSVNVATGADGFLLLQSNVSVSKATNFVKMTQRDDVTLDAKGGATHHLTLTFAANYTYDQVYGYMTYRDYLRIYTPPQSHLLGGSGFDSGQPLCWSPYVDSAQPDLSQTEPAIFAGVPGCSEPPYAKSELDCPPGRYSPGPQAPNLTGSDGYTPWALDQLGGPTNTTSDLPNRAMFAGFVVVPDYCTATVTLTWYTPNVAPKP